MSAHSNSERIAVTESQTGSHSPEPGGLARYAPAKPIAPGVEEVTLQVTFRAAELVLLEEAIAKEEQREAAGTKEAGLRGLNYHPGQEASMLLLERSAFELSCRICAKELKRAKHALKTSTPQIFMALCPRGATLTTLRALVKVALVVYHFDQNEIVSENGAHLRVYLPEGVGKIHQNLDLHVLAASKRVLDEGHDSPGPCTQLGKSLPCRVLVPPSPLALVNAFNAALLRWRMKRTAGSEPGSFLDLVRNDGVLDHLEVRVVPREQLEDVRQFLRCELLQRPPRDAQVIKGVLPATTTPLVKNAKGARNLVSGGVLEIAWVHLPQASKYIVLCSRVAGPTQHFTFPVEALSCLKRQSILELGPINLEVLTKIVGLPNGDYEVRVQAVGDLALGMFSEVAQPSPVRIRRGDAARQTLVEVSNYMVTATERTPLKHVIEKALEAGADEDDEVIQDAWKFHALLRDKSGQERSRFTIRASSYDQLRLQMKLQSWAGLQRAIGACLESGVPEEDELVQEALVMVQVLKDNVHKGNMSEKDYDTFQAESFLREQITMKFVLGLKGALQEAEECGLSQKHPLVLKAKQVLAEQEGVRKTLMETYDDKPQEILAKEIYSNTIQNKEQLLKALINLKAAPDRHIDEEGHTALIAALHQGYQSCAALLVDAKASLTKRDSDGRTCLQLAAALSDEDATVVRQMLSHKVDMKALDNEGRTALHYAAEKSRPEHVQALLDAKADATAMAHDARTPRGMVPIDAGGSAVKKSAVRASAGGALTPGEKAHLALQLAERKQDEQRAGKKGEDVDEADAMANKGPKISAAAQKRLTLVRGLTFDPDEDEPAEDGGQDSISSRRRSSMLVDVGPP